MMGEYTYALINGVVLFFPAVLSFSKTYRPNYFLLLCFSILASALFFIVWDIWFVKAGVWGFNDQFITGRKFMWLPLEEALFFVTIPYASLFLMRNLQRVMADVIPEGFVTVLLQGLVVLSAMTVLFFYDRIYTFVVGLLFIIVTLYALKAYPKLTHSFFNTFLIIVIPFVGVNGILTGFLNTNNEPVVWYNNAEILGYRAWSIPLEDFFYAFVLLLIPLLIFEKIKGRAGSW